MPSCYDRLCKPSVLHKAWRRLNKSNKQSHGFDNETIQKFKDHLDENIQKISKSLKGGEYNFVPLRAKPIPKEGGGVRILRIPAVRDRVVLTALKMLIERRLQNFNRPCSFGYVKGRSRLDAIAAIRKLAGAGNKWLMEADIKKFFDTVPRPILKEKFVREVRFRSITPIVERAIDLEVGNRDQFGPCDAAFLMAESGIPQGGVLSPMLANLYLSEFDIAMEKAGFNLVRYADDFIVLCPSKEEAKRAYSLCLQVLEEKLGLEIHHLGEPGEKTRIFHFSEGFQFLGLEFRGNRVIPAGRAVDRFKARVVEILDPSSAESLLQGLNSLKNTVSGWGDAFRPYHSTETFQLMDDYIRERLTLYLRGRGLLAGRDAFSNKEVRHIGIPSLSRLKQRAATTHPSA